MKAPYLNFNKADPLVVPPSGKTNNGAYLPVVSINCYLYTIVSIAFYLFSVVPPLGKYIESTISPRVPIKGAV